MLYNFFEWTLEAVVNIVLGIFGAFVLGLISVVFWAFDINIPDTEYSVNLELHNRYEYPSTLDRLTNNDSWYVDEVYDAFDVSCDFSDVFYNLKDDDVTKYFSEYDKEDMVEKGLTAYEYFITQTEYDNKLEFYNLSVEVDGVNYEFYAEYGANITELEVGMLEINGSTYLAECSVKITFSDETVYCYGLDKVLLASSEELKTDEEIGQKALDSFLEIIG